MMSSNAPRPAAGDSGLLFHLKGTLGAFAQYLRARCKLAGIEAKEAAAHYGIIVALLVLAFGAVVLGYILLVLAAVFLLAAWTGWYWAWITLAVALPHFAGAALLVLLVKERAEEPMFQASLNELRKDQQWLTSTPPAQKPS